MATCRRRALPIAVDEINKSGGFKVGGKTYKLDLIAPDTSGDPKEASIQLKQLLESGQSQVRIRSVPVQRLRHDRALCPASSTARFLMMGGGTRIHDFLGTPDNDFLIRTWNWDAGPKGFGDADGR